MVFFARPILSRLRVIWRRALPLMLIILGFLTAGTTCERGDRMGSNSSVNSTPPSVIDRDQAIKIAEKALLALGAERDFMIKEDKIVERDFGWVFFYAPRRYLTTRDRKYLIPGNGPLVVYRSTGSTEFLGTSRPPNVAIEILEERLRENR